MLLREIAHSRTGDKGNVVTISLIAYRAQDFGVIEQCVTAERVRAFFEGITDRPVLRYSLPHLAALNFVLFRSEAQQVTRSLALDAHGKCLGSTLLGMDIEHFSDGDTPCNTALSKLSEDPGPHSVSAT